MGLFGILLCLVGTVVVSSQASSVWQYNIPAAYRDYEFLVESVRKPCYFHALAPEAAPITEEINKPLLQILEGPKIEALSFLEAKLPEVPKLPALTLPEFNIIVKESEDSKELGNQITLTNIPKGPALEEHTWSSSVVKSEESGPIDNLHNIPPLALASVSVEIPSKPEPLAPAVISCGICELPSYSPAQVIIQSPWEWSANYAPLPAPEWSASNDKISNNFIPELPTLSEYHVELPSSNMEYIIASQPEPETITIELATIPEGPILSPFTIPEIPAANEKPAPELTPVFHQEITSLELLSPPSLPTKIIVGESLQKPCNHEIEYALETVPAFPEININTVEEIHEDRKESLEIPDVPQLPPFSFPQKIEIEVAKPELPEIAIIPELQAHIEIPNFIESHVEPIEKIDLGPIPEGPALPEFSLPSFLPQPAQIEIEENAQLHESVSLVEPITAQTYEPIINIPQAPTLGEINLEEIRLPEVSLPSASIDSSTPCNCDKKGEKAPLYVPEYPKWSAQEGNDWFFKLPAIDFRIKPAEEFTSYYSPKYCVDNIIKERVLPNLISEPKELTAIPDGPKLSFFKINSLPVV